MKIKSTPAFLVFAAVALFAILSMPPLHASPPLSAPIMLAQVTPPAGAVTVPAPAELPTADKAVAAIAAVLSPILVAAAKKFIPTMPSWLPPLLSVAFGLAVTVLNTFISAHPGLPWWAGAALGVLGIGLREVKDQALPAPNGGWPTT